MDPDEERTFKAEYAKSWRSRCKQCCKSIPKNSLRLAKMVQRFNGNQPNWYHFDCFYEARSIKFINEVSGYGFLRWKDQKRICKKIPRVVKGADGTRSDLKVEYATSNRSCCRSCSSKIDKGEIRIAKMVLNRADDPYTYWHHVDCFLKDLESLDASGVTAEELFGFTNLKKEDKEELKTKFIPPLKQAKKGKKRKAKREEEGFLPPVKVFRKDDAESEDGAISSSLGGSSKKLNKIDDSPLDGLAIDDNLGDLCEVLENLAAKWRTIATNLRLRDNAMEIIEGNNSRDVARCLQLALRDWLKLNYNYERNGLPSWRMLAKAIQNLDAGLFNRIIAEHPAKQIRNSI